MSNLLFQNSLLARVLAPDMDENDEFFFSSGECKGGENKMNVVEKLLLNGGDYTMKISPKEEVCCFNINARKGVLGIDGWIVPTEQFEAKTFDECVRMLVDKYKASEIQVIPTHVCDNSVDRFMVMLASNRDK